MKTATYKDRLVYVLYVNDRGSLALVSYNEDGTKAFKADTSQLTNLNFTIKYSEEF